MRAFNGTTSSCYVYAVDANVASIYCVSMAKKVSSNSDMALRFGNRVRLLRTEKAKCSQEELAERAGLHRTFVGRVERGETNITLENMHRIVNALGVSLSEFFSGIEGDTNA